MNTPIMGITGPEARYFREMLWNLVAKNSATPKVILYEINRRGVYLFRRINTKTKIATSPIMYYAAPQESTKYASDKAEPRV